VIGVRFKVDAEAFADAIDQELVRFEYLASDALYQSATEAVMVAKATTLFKDQTGKLRQSIAQRPTGFFSRAIRATRPYASFVHNGTPKHTITAKDGGVLRFQVNGRWVSKKSVEHPGTKASPFIQSAADAAQGPLASRLEAAAKKAFG
jgi:hypothetical protein